MKIKKDFFSQKMFIVTEYAALRVLIKKIIFLFLNQNICCGYSKEPSRRDGSFEQGTQKNRLDETVLLSTQNIC